MASDNIDNPIKKLNERMDLLSHRLEQLEKKTMKRIVKKILVPPVLQKIQLHEQTTQYHIDLFDYLPMNESVKAALVTVKVKHSNHPAGHAYLGFDAYQQRCANGQKTCFYEQTYNCHGTAHQQELIVPWDNTGVDCSTNLVIDITSSYNTGSYPDCGNVNYFQIQVTGYIL